jgi:hypothetical protein
MTLISLIAKTPTSSRTKLLDDVLLCTNYYIKLFVNHVDESNPSFVEASFLGYSQIILNKEDWLDAVVENNLAVSYYKHSIAWFSKESFNVVIYGYYIVDSSGAVVWYEKFPFVVILAENRGINIIPKIVLGSAATPQPTATRYPIPTRAPATPTPTSTLATPSTPTLTSTPSLTPSPTVEPTPTPPGYTFPPEQLFISSFFKINQSLDQFFVVNIQDPLTRSLARTAISRGYENIWLVGQVMSGQETYNAHRRFILDPGSVRFVESIDPPNENADLPVSQIEEYLANGQLVELTEVCFMFSGIGEEMKIKGILDCFLPLIWKTRNEVDLNTNEFIQFGYCEGECTNKIINDYCESCPDSEEIYVETAEEWEAQYQIILQEIEYRIDNQEIDIDEVLDEMRLLSRTQEQIDLDNDIAALEEYLDINYLMEGL